MGKENIVQDKSYAFALRIIKLYKHLIYDKKEFVLSKQILKSGTAIGANIEEAIGGSRSATLVRQKNPKPFPPRPATLNRSDAGNGEAHQLAKLRQGPARQPGWPICRRWGDGTSSYCLLATVVLTFDQKDTMDSR